MGEVATVRVVIADDHPEVRSALSELLRQVPGIDVVAVLATAEQAVAAAALDPDVAVLDVGMLDGEMTAARALTAVGVRAVLLSAQDTPEVREEAEQVGVDRYIVKADGENLVEAVLRVAIS